MRAQQMHLSNRIDVRQINDRAHPIRHTAEPLLRIAAHILDQRRIETHEGPIVPLTSN